LPNPEETVPTYQYACTACGHQLEAVQSFTDEPLTECPSCAGRLRKVFNSVGIVFKGSGFYRTDSRPAGSESSDSDGTAPAKSATTGSGSDSSTSGASGNGSGGGNGSDSGNGSGSGNASGTGGSAPKDKAPAAPKSTSPASAPSGAA
jgi:putative FmdB family regulatory protein